MRNVQRVKRKVVDRLFQWLRAGYYLIVFGRKLPFTGALESTVHRWEAQKGKGDVPKAREAWDAQYRTNQWAYLDRLDEVSRYAVITGYIAYLKPRATVLDVGCGDGILLSRYEPYGYARYVGLDISVVAIAKLMPKQNAHTTFLQADAEAYQPQQYFDVIVFNEAHYYLHDPLRAIGRYAKALNPGGVMIFSTYTASRRAMVILRHLKAHYEVVDETKTTQGAKSWFCTVLALTKQQNFQPIQCA